jgi:antitoxin component of MazEF toxin-antitoxin module
MQRKLQKIGNSRGIILDRTMREHIGIDDSDQVEVTLTKNAIVISAPRACQSFEDAMAATFRQYDNTMKRLAE